VPKVLERLSARKALALHGLDDKLGAEFAAAQTYNLAQEIFLFREVYQVLLF
jgi:hypothetical protein